MMSTAESTLRARIRAELPPDAFVRRPLRILLAVPLIGVIVGISAVLVATPLPWYATLLAWAVLGNAYVALMFFGHEVAHGAVVRSERLQNAVLTFSLAIFVVSPHLWRHWHNRLHHGHTNVPGIDPDRYDLLDELGASPRPLRWLTIRLAPGSGHWLSAVYLFVAFTAHAQSVLWHYSRRQPHGRYRFRRALAETALAAAFWIAMAILAGPRGAFDVIAMPMLLANAIVMAYITTNHMLRPLSNSGDSLSTTLGVTTLRSIDALHLHFSHHLEHHLFPSMSHRYYPLVRRGLEAHAGPGYTAPAHWRALLTIYRTPRHYADYDTLIDPRSGERVSLAAVEHRLRAGDQSMGAAA
ncbi:MAG TPA: fatty acid desaturase [Candidatus Binatia bacterium]|nr:fatty acid desaturase [Candidatus Binatia bacterium]